MTDYPDWQTPDAHAASIFATGVPLYSKPTNVLNDQLHNLPANVGTNIIANLAVSQIGYQIYLKVASPAGTGLPFCTMTLNWLDSLTGVVIAHEEWSLGAGSASGGSVYLGTGPTKGDLLTVTAFNEDTVNAMTLTTILHENSRVYSRDDWRQESVNSIPGFSIVGHAQQANCLIGFNGSIGAGAKMTSYVPLYAGKARIAALGFGQAGNVFLDTLDPAINIGGVQQGPGCIYADNIAATGLTTNQVVTLPRAPTIVRVANTGGAAASFSLGIYIDEYLT